MLLISFLNLSPNQIEFLTILLSVGLVFGQDDGPPIPEDRQLDDLLFEEKPPPTLKPIDKQFEDLLHLQSDLPFNVTDGDGLYHVGDMRLNEFQFINLYGTEEERQAFANPHCVDAGNGHQACYNPRWEGGVLRFRFDGYYPENFKNRVRQEVAKFNDYMGGCPNIQ